MRHANPTRPYLDPIPLADVLPFRPGRGIITMSVGQWDALLAAAYIAGWVLLELDDLERPVRAYLARPRHWHPAPPVRRVYFNRL